MAPIVGSGRPPVRGAREGREELLGRDVGRVERGDGLRAALGRDELSRVWPLRVGEPGRVEPGLDRLDLRCKVGGLLGGCWRVETKVGCGRGRRERRRGRVEHRARKPGSEGESGDARTGKRGTNGAARGRTKHTQRVEVGCKREPVPDESTFSALPSEGTLKLPNAGRRRSPGCTDCLLVDNSGVIEANDASAAERREIGRAHV